MYLSFVSIFGGVISEMEYENDREILDWNEDDHCPPEETSLDNYSQVKRRRMLQFQNEALDHRFCNLEMSSVFLKTKDRENLYEEALTDQRFSSFSEASSGYEQMDQSTEGWLDNCFNNSEKNNNPNCVDYCNYLPEEALTDQNRPNLRRLKGPYKRAQAKVASSIAYPFDIIKPSAYRGDTTLDEINKWIHSPISSKQKKKSNRDPLATYPTSAFSGKSVVGKTTIHMEGGQGSITIMKTRG